MLSLNPEKRISPKEIIQFLDPKKNEILYTQWNSYDIFSFFTNHYLFVPALSPTIYFEYGSSLEATYISLPTDANLYPSASTPKTQKIIPQTVSRNWIQVSNDLSLIYMIWLILYLMDYIVSKMIYWVSSLVFLLRYWSSYEWGTITTI